MRDDVASLRETLNEVLEQQKATGEILRVISQSQTDAQPVFDMIAERAMRLCGALHGGVIRYDGKLLHVAAHVDVSPQFSDALRRTYPMRPSPGTASARAVLTRATVHIPDIEKDPEYVFTEAARTAGFRSALAVPMLRDGQAIGSIVVFGGEEAWRAIPIVVITARDLSREDRERLNGYVEKILQKGAHGRDQLLAEVRELVSASVARRRPQP